MVKGFVSKKAGSHKLKAFSRAREVALISNPWCYGMHQLFLCTVCTTGPAISSERMIKRLIPLAVNFVWGGIFFKVFI